MKKQLLSISIIIFCINAYAQNFIWSKSLGGTIEDMSYSLATDGSGNIYTTGYLNGTADFDPGTGTYNLSSSGQTDIFVSKINATGNFVWAIRIGEASVDYGSSIVTDTLGFIYITGQYAGTVDFNPGKNVNNLTSAGGADIFILKLDTSGNFIWAKSIGGIDSDLGRSISVDNRGGVVTTGYFKDTVDFDPNSGTYKLVSQGQNDIFISKLDSSGNFVWAKTIGAKQNDHGISLVVDQYGNIYATGEYRGDTVDFDPGTGICKLVAYGSTYNIFILKLSSSGQFVWAKGIGTVNGQYVGSLAIDTSQNIFITGQFHDKTDFDPDTSTFYLTTNGYWDLFVLKLNSAGKFIWAKGMGGTTGTAIPSVKGNSIVSDNSGNSYITGRFQSTIDLNPDPKVSYNLTSKSNYDIFLLKLDFYGNFVWAKSIGDISDDIGKQIIIDNFGNIISTGQYAATVNFHIGSGTYNLTGNGDYDIYILKFCLPPTIGKIAGLSSVCEGNSETYTIDPHSGATGYKWYVPIGSTIINGQNTNSITVTFGATSGNIGVYPINSCGTGVSESFAVKINPKPKVGFSALPSSTICKGSNLTLNGTGALTYTWSGGIQNGVAFTPDSNTTYIVTGTTLKGCKDSDTVKVSVLSYPVINRNPADQNSNVGSPVLFSISTSSQFMTYQWQKDSGTGFTNIINGSEYTGVDNDTLNIHRVHFLKNGWQYRCIAANGSCSDTSDAAKLTANCILSLTKQPVNKTINVGSDALFTLTASSPTSSYKWQLDSGTGFIDISNGGQYAGTSNDSLTIKSVKYSQNNYKFCCIVSEDGCSDTSNIVSMIVNCTLAITSQPSNQTGNVGSKVLFVSSSSSASANYQWLTDNGSGFVKLTNGGQYSGVTNDTLTISSITYSQNNYRYKCIAEDGGCLDSSNTALLKVNCVSNITTQPINQTANVGAKVLFTAVSSSSSATYQWQENSGTGFSNLSNSGQYSGVTNDTLTITNLTFSQNNYSYRCKVEDQGCSDSTKIALLTVKTIGINKVLNSGIKIYPNPANSKIFIELTNGALTYKKLEIFNGNGQKCLSIPVDIGSQPIEVNVEKLNKGLYLVKLMNDEGYIFTKMIKN